MTTLREQVDRWIDETLDGMFKHPRMYGSLESVELQALLLLELRAFVARPETESRTPGRVFDAWLANVRRREPHIGNTSLGVALQRSYADDPDAQFESLSRSLDEFRRELVGGLQPDNPFATHDLALALRMRKGGRLPSAARIGSFYGLVGQVMRSVVRGGGGRGRLQREYEAAIAVFPAGGFEIVPENGIGAQIIIPLDWPRSPQPSLPTVFSPEEFVRDTFARFVNVAAWASDEREPIERLMQAVPELTARTRMTLDAMRLLPPMQGDVEAVEIGGRAILRELPVSLRPEARARLLDVLTHDQTPAPFEGTGVLRMVDLDEGRLRLRTIRPGEGKSSVEVWLTGTDTVERAATMLGREVQVTGTRFVRPTGAPFVVASRVVLTGVDADDAVDDSD